MSDNSPTPNTDSPEMPANPCVMDFHYYERIARSNLKKCQRCSRIVFHLYETTSHNAAPPRLVGKFRSRQ